MVGDVTEVVCDDEDDVGFVAGRDVRQEVVEQNQRRHDFTPTHKSLECIQYISSFYTSTSQCGWLRCNYVSKIYFQRKLCRFLRKS